jgi:hypothetical protein
VRVEFAATAIDNGNKRASADVDRGARKHAPPDYITMQGRWLSP